MLKLTRVDGGGALWVRWTAIVSVAQDDNGTKVHVLGGYPVGHFVSETADEIVAMYSFQRDREAGR